jgi:arabinose-5-phosphate isomerase
MKNLEDYIKNEITNVHLALNGLLVTPGNILGMEYLKQEIVKTVNSKGKVIFTGIGKNVYACEKLAASYSSIGIPSFFMDAVHAVHGDLGVLGDNDLLVCLSKSGNTSELVNTLTYINANKDKFTFKIVGIDCNVSGVENGFDKFCNFAIHVNTYNEIDSLNLVPTVSAIVLQIVGDIVGVYAAESALGFNKDVFKLNHPGGTIGQTLSTKPETTTV